MFIWKLFKAKIRNYDIRIPLREDWNIIKELVRFIIPAAFAYFLGPGVTFNQLANFSFDDLSTSEIPFFEITTFVITRLVISFLYYLKQPFKGEKELDEFS